MEQGDDCTNKLTNVFHDDFKNNLKLNVKITYFCCEMDSQFIHDVKATRDIKTKIWNNHTMTVQSFPQFSATLNNHTIFLSLVSIN